MSKDQIDSLVQEWTFCMKHMKYSRAHEIRRELSEHDITLRHDPNKLGGTIGVRRA